MIITNISGTEDYMTPIKVEVEGEVNVSVC